MPRQRTQYRRTPHAFPDDFPQRQVWFKHASGLSWVEIARRLGVDPVTVRRWWQRGARPNYRHLKALQDLGRRPGPRSPVHRLRRPAGEAARDHSG